MLEVSSTGPAQLKHKTINAEVNLLTEWQRERSRVNEQIARTAGVLALILLVAFGSLPFLLKSFWISTERLTASRTALKDVSADLVLLETARKEAKPRIDQSAMHETVTHEARQFLGHTMLVLNSASAGMAFETVTSNVIGGELTLHVKADAESNAVAQTFIEQAGGGPNVNSTLLATAQKNGKLSADGIGFDYVKRIGVKP
ncbi:MAG: hypothetical protein QOJ65_2528 [Fimbriimonadaceae bacterium]|jgi:hypothetical protein|nr:hypothetical protein [Fimbriimonadaceae bacterium]